MWILPRASYELNDVIGTVQLTPGQINGVQIPATRRNLLALVFFGARYTDERARALCPFIAFPKPEPTLTRVNAKGR